jgi:outer membrane lipoprotein-sorting protein
MRKLALLFVFISTASVGFSQAARDTLANYAKSLAAAKSLKSNYEVQPIGGIRSIYDVQLSKPNLARLDTPTDLIVVDGSKITVYSKADNSYFSMAESAQSLLNMLSHENLQLWIPFFKAGELSSLPRVTYKGFKTIRGQEFTWIEANMDLLGKKVENFYFDKQGLPRQIEINNTDKNTTTVYNTSHLQISQDPISADSFVFSPPSGARELTMDQVAQGRWFDNVSDAKRMASLTHRGVVLAFVSKWSQSSNRLQREVFNAPQFAQESQSFVFCKVDIDASPDLAKSYKVKGVPDVFFLTSGGQQVGNVHGYVPLDEFMPILEKAKAGLFK